MTIRVDPGTIALYTDVACGWATVALHRFYAARAAAGLAEALHAAKAQGIAAAEELDLALRRALFVRSRPISMLHEILDVADACPTIDVAALREALDDGRARGQMMRDYRTHRQAVQGSPHFFLADGSDAHNPGIEFHWAGGDEGEGSLVIDSDDTEAMARLVRQAAGHQGGTA